MTVAKLVRNDILRMAPYTATPRLCDEIYLDKNENPWPGINLFSELQLNRYPKDAGGRLFQVIADHYRVNINNILLSRGSDEAIDLIIRVFCEPNYEGILIFPPTFSRYEMFARINANKVQAIPLQQTSWQLDLQQIFKKIKSWVKVIFICSPNNPTGNLIPITQILEILTRLSDKLVVVDEAYIEFSEATSALALLAKFPNLVILRTLSKAFGMAGIRCGICFAHEETVSYLCKIASPYSLTSFTIHAAVQVLAKERQSKLAKKITILQEEREKTYQRLALQDSILNVWPSAANFILFQHEYCEAFYQFCLTNKVLLRRLNDHAISQCLRVTIGSPEQNLRFLELLTQFDAYYE